MSNLITGKINKVDNFSPQDSIFACLFIAEKIRQLRNHATGRNASNKQIFRIKEKSAEFCAFRSKLLLFGENLERIESELDCAIYLFRRDTKKTDLEEIRRPNTNFTHRVNLLTTNKNQNIFR